MRSGAIGSFVALAATPLAAGLLETVANPAVKENYASGEVMEDIMSKKYVSTRVSCSLLFLPTPDMPVRSIHGPAADNPVL